MPTTIIFQLGDGVFWLSALAGIFGLLIAAGVIWFTVRAKREDERLIESAKIQANSEMAARRFNLQFLALYLENRASFFVAFGQILIAITLIVVLTVLLLTRTISAEAGLPILSAIAGFAIAKGASVARTNALPAPEQSGSDEKDSAAKNPLMPEPKPVQENKPDG